MGARQGSAHSCVAECRAASLGFKAFTQQEVGVGGWVVEKMGVEGGGCLLKSKWWAGGEESKESPCDVIVSLEV